MYIYIVNELISTITTCLLMPWSIQVQHPPSTVGIRLREPQVQRWEGKSLALEP